MQTSEAGSEGISISSATGVSGWAGCEALCDWSVVSEMLASSATCCEQSTCKHAGRVRHEALESIQWS